MIEDIPKTNAHPSTPTNGALPSPAIVATGPGAGKTDAEGIDGRPSFTVQPEVSDEEWGASKVAAVIVAAGRGERFGAASKVLAPLLGRPVLAWTLDAVNAAPVDEIVVVAGDHTRREIADLLATDAWPKARSLVLGGATRQESVAAGVAAVTGGCELVVIHDAARPLTTSALFAESITAARRHGAAIVATPVTDTLKRVEDGRVVATVDRQGLWAAQTPQVFRRRLLTTMSDCGQGHQVTDEAMLCETLGIPVVIVPGSPENLKITHPGDLALAAALLTARGEVNPGSSAVPTPDISVSSPGLPESDTSGLSHEAGSIQLAGAFPVFEAATSEPPPEIENAANTGASPASATGSAHNHGTGQMATTGPNAEPAPHPSGTPRWPRTGIGYDVHQLVPGRRLVLGGVEIAYQAGLDGHSDADVLLHALCDALLGAAALGDIGQHFPPGDARFKDADSRDLLRESVRLLAAAGWEPVNVDATLIAEAPRIAPHVPRMRSVVAALLGVEPGAVSIKATTNETMGFVGRQEGMAAIATALIAPRYGN